MFRGSAYSIETDKDTINNSELFEENIKVALVGISDVGKSSMLNCIENEAFNQEINNTKSFQLRFKKLRINNIVISLKIWDGAGDKMGEFLEKGQFSSVDGFVEVFDLTERQSLHQLQGLHDELKKYFKANGRPFLSLLVGNKADLAQSSQSQETEMTDFLANKFSNKQEMLYLKASAKNNQFVKDSFVEIIKIVLKERHSNSKIFETEEEITEKCKCCRPISCQNLCRIF